METLVYSYRGPLKDLSYSGSAAVVNSEGKLLFYCGEPQKTVYMRSSAKPMHGTFLAYILMMIGQKTLRPTVISMYNYVQPIVGTSVSIL